MWRQQLQCDDAPADLNSLAEARADAVCAALPSAEAAAYLAWVERHLAVRQREDRHWATSEMPRMQQGRAPLPKGGHRPDSR